MLKPWALGRGARGARARRDDQEQEDGDDAPTRGYPVVPVAPRSALGRSRPLGVPLASESVTLFIVIAYLNTRT